jgi:type I restriction enzyme S subunit
MVSTIVVNQQENARLASVRDALLPKLMSGEIDVTDIAF